MSTATQPTNPYGVGVGARLNSGERGTVFPLFGDAHVHLGLVEPESLPSGGIGRVLDLGWSLAAQQDWSQGSITGLNVDYAGNFLAAPGGYPSDRSWAPRDATVFVEDPVLAIAQQVAAGVSAIKITLNADAGPVHSDEVLLHLVKATHAAGLTPVIHAEGEGQAERAIHAGQVVLAHTPFSELLSDEEISFAAQNNVGWMSTLDIHGYGDYGTVFEIASANLTRFIAAGGNVFYGTDLGNGPLPLGINVRELRALQACGLTDSGLAASLFSWWEKTGSVSAPSNRMSFISDISDSNSSDVCTWLASARIVETTEVESS
ncbi:hydrolase [Aurantimicrobium minutum]|uniref:hydrolase n=1 Tax=Aurantimicrobium minutum TaxID=708131 RepID=UPI0024758E46|nr:hydrolase [Aurantimicrobium minutum]MDH6423304.1 imidazolonepropionase-like amidohydrolase [Aurantimicrobium minutum]